MVMEYGKEYMSTRRQVCKTHMLVSGGEVKLRVMECIHGVMGISMKENGKDA